MTEGRTVKAVGFRLLFGADLFPEPARIDEQFFEKFKTLIPFYPLYSATVIELLKIYERLYDTIPLIAFFETSFFSRLPREEKYYALPIEYLEEYNYKRWGFHGVLHEYAAKAVPGSKKIISVVFDKQTTVCALTDTRPVTISLGYTPLEGIMGRTTCGDLDPGVVFYLMKQCNYSIYKIDEILKRESGFVGMTGYDLEMTDMLKLEGKDPKVTLAFEVFQNHLLKYIGEGIAMLGGIDTIVFSGSALRLYLPLIYSLSRKLNFLGLHVTNVPWPENHPLEIISSPESTIYACLNFNSSAQILREQLTSKQLSSRP